MAYEDVFAVKALESRAIHVGVGPVALVSIGLQVISAAVATPVLLATLLILLLLLYRQRTERYNTRIELNDEEDAEICQQHQEEKDEVDGQECSRNMGIMPALNVEVNCMSSRQPVCFRRKGTPVTHRICV
jgi:hypothetical protein